MNVDLKMKGFKEIEKTLHDHPMKLDKKRRAEIMKTAHLIRTAAIKNIDKNKTTDAGGLKGSIIADSNNSWASAEIGSAKKNVKGVTVNYAECVEFGTRPHFPPSSKLEMWVKRKLLKGGGSGASSGSGKNRQLNMIKGIAFVVARAISKKGTPAQPFLHPAFQKYENKLPKTIKTSFEKGRY